MYGHVITKFSRMGSLPHFLTHGAPLRAVRARELRYNLRDGPLENLLGGAGSGERAAGSGERGARGRV